MRIKILTLFPEMYKGFLDTSVIKRIINRGIAEIELVDIREYSLDKHRHVDDTPYGGGAGMLMKVDVAYRALMDNINANSHIILTSPKGKTYNQKKAYELSKKEEILIFCGHYEGIDARIEEYCDELISVGDYILTGGELPSMIITDSILRLLNDSIAPESLKEESFNNGLLEYPQYTRPFEFDGKSVPEVLLSGNHKEIRRYNLKMSLLETLKHRPDLLKRKLSEEEIELLLEIKKDIEGEKNGKSI